MAVLPRARFARAIEAMTQAIGDGTDVAAADAAAVAAVLRERAGKRS